uniref:Uncharacterized protein n=1 Tax=Romanomermis culicivorax TaxID=13658 RepID=A0A915KWJ1_ROMCU
MADCCLVNHAMWPAMPGGRPICGKFYKPKSQPHIVVGHMLRLATKHGRPDGTVAHLLPNLGKKKDAHANHAILFHDTCRMPDAGCRTKYESALRPVAINR